MTRNFGPNDHDQAAHHWLTEHQHALAHALDDLLDTEAGLREILLHSHHDNAADNLDTVLDTEAGLAAIIPTPPTPPADTHETTPHHTDTTELLHALSPADRMTLRNDPEVKTANQALARDRDRARTHVRNRDRAVALACDLADALPRDLALARALDLALNLNSAFDLAHALALALARNLGNPRPLADALARGAANARDRAVALARDLDNAPARVRALNAADALARATARARDLSGILDLDLDLDLDLIVEIRTAEVGRHIGRALRREPLVLDKGSLHALLDDFTATDLSNADLTGIDLGGVYWSEHTTQWPPAINVEDLKARSTETPSGSGTWIVRSGTATIRDLAER